MKKKLPPFLAGMATMAIVGSLSISALAATGQMTINVDPINVQVNGQTFQPKDEQGNDVPVFKYNGTTYAPLRALAEAYGLTVGYDAKANMATVGAATPAPDTATPGDYSSWSAEDEAAYQEFKGLWEINIPSDSPVPEVNLSYKGSMLEDELLLYLKSQYNNISRFVVTEFDIESSFQTLIWFHYKDNIVASASTTMGSIESIFVGNTRIYK